MGLAPQIAHADAHAAAADSDLRDWCLSAAVAIKDECAGLLSHSERNDGGQQGKNTRGSRKCGTSGVAAEAGAAAVDDGHLHDCDDDAASDRENTKTSHTLVDCGEPLVQLLSRQATRLIGLYANVYQENEANAAASPVGRGACEPARLPGQERGGQQQFDFTLPSSSPQRQDSHSHACNRNHAHPPSLSHELVLKRLDDLLSIAYTRFYAYLYKNLPLCWRQLYTDATILKFSYLYLLFRRPPDDHCRSNKTDDEPEAPPAAADPTSLLGTEDGNSKGDKLDEMIKTLDLALILAGAGGRDRGRKWIDKAFGLLERVQVQRAAIVTPAGSCMDAGIAAADSSAAASTAASHHHEKTAGDIPVSGAAAPPVLPPPAKRVKLEYNSTTNNYDAHADPIGAATGPVPQIEPSNPQPSSSFSARRPFTPPVRHAIRRVAATDMDMSAFQRYMDVAPLDRGPEPLVLTGLVDDWPARRDRPWDKPAYLLSRTFGGRRLVPVEVGRSYVDQGWGQKIVSFGDFLRQYIDTSLLTPPMSSPPRPSASVGLQQSTTATAGHSPERSSPETGAQHQQERRQEAHTQQQQQTNLTTATATTAYLAQHQLFLQLPQLRHDILIPDHCYTAPPPHPNTNDPSRNLAELDQPLLNAWFGPPGTITPLHTDPYHNFLAQVVGSKYVRLYSPHESQQNMRRRGKEGGVDMGNTSFWDVGVVEGWDDTAGGASSRGDDCGGQIMAGGENGDRAEDEECEVDNFRKVPFVDCILEPGDALYIPIGWWHYVRGLSVSFSVSIWWN